MSSKTEWIWDVVYQTWWRYQVDARGQYVKDEDGNYVRDWQTPPDTGQARRSKDVAAAAQPVPIRRDSKYEYDSNMALPAPDDVKDRLIFKGTPDRGWYETLDIRYRVRTRTEERTFFRPGRVFAMLWSETAGSTTSAPAGGTENTRYTTNIFPVKFGQVVHCSIRRFVVVRVSRQQHYVEACAITTYSQRGTTKRGCNPAEHTIVYLDGQSPQALPGESGMINECISIVPTDPHETMDPLSRLRLGKIFSIECNVKVRDIGMVGDRTKFLRLHKEVRNDEFEPDDMDIDTPGQYQSYSHFQALPQGHEYQHNPSHNPYLGYSYNGDQGYSG